MQTESMREVLKKSHIIGQHCQRNYDLDQPMPQEDIDVIIHAATQCPSKQNLDFYSVIAIQDRETIEKIYNVTETARGRKNPQVLGHVLLVFVSNPEVVTNPGKENNKSPSRNTEVRNVYENYGADDQLMKNIREDMHQAVGVAAGYVNLSASMLGYRSGCNKCFDMKSVKEILSLDKSEDVILMMGVGIKDDDRPRREEHFTGQIIDSFKKLPIKVKHI